MREFPGGLAVEKDSALSLLWLRFDPRPRKFHISTCYTHSQKKKKKRMRELSITADNKREYY